MRFWRRIIRSASRPRLLGKRRSPVERRLLAKRRLLAGRCPLAEQSGPRLATAQRPQQPRASQGDGNGPCHHQHALRQVAQQSSAFHVIGSRQPPDAKQRDDGTKHHRARQPRLAHAIVSSGGTLAGRYPSRPVTRPARPAVRPRRSTFRPARWHRCRAYRRPAPTERRVSTCRPLA